MIPASSRRFRVIATEKTALFRQFCYKSVLCVYRGQYGIKFWFFTFITGWHQDRNFFLIMGIKTVVFLKINHQKSLELQYAFGLLFFSRLNHFRQRTVFLNVFAVWAFFSMKLIQTDVICICDELTWVFSLSYHYLCPNLVHLKTSLTKVPFLKYMQKFEKSNVIFF